MAAVTAAVIGATAAIAGTTMSFVQAGEQKAMRNAERDADEAMQQARKKLETNVYASQGIQKEPYELEREALLAQGAQAIQAGVESERGAAATAGRVQLAQQQGQAGIRTAMGQELTALENKQLQEESRLRDIGVQLDLGEVSGAQLAAANAQQLQAQSMQQGFQGLANVGQQVANFVPLYSKQSVDAQGYAVTERPTMGKYALENKATRQQEQQYQQQLSNLQSFDFNPLLNKNVNPYSTFYNNPSVEGYIPK